MLIISDSDEEVLLRTRRMLYAAGIMTITLPYTELLTVKFDETVYGLILEDPYDSQSAGKFRLYVSQAKSEHSRNHVQTTFQRRLQFTLECRCTD